MLRLQAGVEAPLLGCRDRFLAGAEAVALGDEGRRCGVLLGDLGRQRMVGGQRAEGSPEQRVRARGEHRQELVALAVSSGAPLDAEADGGALGAADPLALHEETLLRPAVEAVEPAQQFGDRYGGG